jgi:hypothetical protein
VTWQEELRKLDEDFSSGNITADEYRVRRDQVLSSAVAPQPEPPAGQGGNADETQIVAPVQQPPTHTPQQPPQPPPPPSAAEPTQVVPGTVAGGGDADRTQAVPPEMYQQADMYGQSSPPYGFPQQQQYPPSPAGGFPQQPPAEYQQPGYQQPAEYQQPAYEQPQQQYEQPQWHSAQSQEEATPLWGGDQFPPIAPPTEPDWVTQGPEFTKDTEEKGRTGKIVGAVLAVVLLAGIAFGAWWLWGRDSGEPTAGPGGGEKTSQQPGPTSESSAPTTPEPPKDPLPIAELPGNPEEHPEVTTFPDMEDKNYLNDKELSAYEKAGAGDTKFHVQHLGDGVTAVLVLAATDSGKKAEAAVKQLRKIQISNGAKDARKSPENVYVTEYTNKKNAEIRAHYVSGNVIVRIEVKSDQGLKAARADFLEVLNAQLEELPADG